MQMLTLDKFEEASEKVKEVTLETKLVYSDFLSEQTGNKVYLKPENMQFTGAYKVRGAYYKISTLTETERHASKEDAFFVFDKLADQGRLSHPATAVDYSELKAVRSIQGIQGLQFSFSSDEHQRTSRRILVNYDLLKYT